MSKNLKKTIKNIKKSSKILNNGYKGQKTTKKPSKI